MGRLARVAAAVATATTLHASSPKCPPTPSSSWTSAGLTEMDVRTLFSKTLKQRVAWYTNQLSAYQTELKASAACNGIPQQLLATVILNELADINWQDVWQQRVSNSGSLGVAQIQVGTAKTNKLVEFPGDKLPLSDRQVATRLTIPQYAIEAAAREIRRLLDHAATNNTNPWPKKFSFTLTSVGSLSNPNDIYSHITDTPGGTQRDREENLAEMLVAAYNSPGILDAKKVASITPGAAGFIYNNGTIHGGNSRLIAGELYDNNLFH